MEPNRVLLLRSWFRHPEMRELQRKPLYGSESAAILVLCADMGGIMDYTSLIKEVNIPKLVEALRWCDAGWEHDCEYCPLHLDHNLKCMEKLLSDAAAAIEALEAEVQDLNESLKVESKARENA